MTCKTLYGGTNALKVWPSVVVFVVVVVAAAVVPVVKNCDPKSIINLSVWHLQVLAI
jgi:hypothetical protein